MSDDLPLGIATSGPLQVLSGLSMGGKLNTDSETICAHIASSIRRGHQQVRREGAKTDRIALVGGGPSLNDTVGELRELLWAGAKLVTVNGAYNWALEHNFRPSTQIVLDARESNVRFLSPEVPLCNYVLASQCHPALWDAVEGRERVWIFHPVVSDGPEKDLLDAYYHKLWQPITGGSTVGMRALVVMRTLGYLRFDLFGMDSCFRGAAHHAYPQPENEQDRRFIVRSHPEGHPELEREFHCAPWHLKQLEDFLQLIKFNGEQFLLNVHGDGLLAHALRSNAQLVIEEET
jgi:hypothetical protein